MWFCLQWDYRQRYKKIQKCRLGWEGLLYLSSPLKEGHSCTHRQHYPCLYRALDWTGSYPHTSDKHSLLLFIPSSLSTKNFSPYHLVHPPNPPSQEPWGWLAAPQAAIFPTGAVWGQQPLGDALSSSLSCIPGKWMLSLPVPQAGHTPEQPPEWCPTPRGWEESSPNVVAPVPFSGGLGAWPPQCLLPQALPQIISMWKAKESNKLSCYLLAYYHLFLEQGSWGMSDGVFKCISELFLGALFSKLRWHCSVWWWLCGIHSTWRLASNTIQSNMELEVCAYTKFTHKWIHSLRTKIVWTKPLGFEDWQGRCRNKWTQFPPS